MIKSTIKAQAPTAIQLPAPPAKPQQKQSPRQSPPRRKLMMQRPSPVLRFSPTAWAKLLYFRDRQETEVGGLAVTAPGDLLHVQEFVTVKQDVTIASVAFDDQAVADLYEAQVDAGRKPEQFGRIWCHTHPGDSPQPSGTDEETFARVFGSCQWAIMFILARGGKSYARLRFNVGPGGNIVIPVEVDFTMPFGPSQSDEWDREYKANIHPAECVSVLTDPGDWGDKYDIGVSLTGTTSGQPPFPNDWLEELGKMEPAERQAIIEELDREFGPENDQAVGQRDPWEF